MCTLALFLRQSESYPLVVAANRDEFLARASTGPTAITACPWTVAGLDLVAGGTWLGLNEAGVVVGILNRRTAVSPDPERRSRGLLCLDVLQAGGLIEAEDVARALKGDDYNPFNLLIASAEGALVCQNLADLVAITPLSPGVHLLSNLDLNDPTCPRIAKSHGHFTALAPSLDHSGVEEVVAALQGLLSDHATPLDPRGTGTPNTLCVHLGEYGTRSSTIVIYVAAERRFRYFHADGPPCRTEYREIVLPGR